MLGLANRQASMTAAAQWSFVRQVIRGLPRGWNETILESVRKVLAAEIKNAIKEYILPIFSAETSNLIVACAPIMQQVS